MRNELDYVLNEAVHIPNESSWQQGVMDAIDADVSELSGLHIFEEFSGSDMKLFLDEE